MSIVDKISIVSKEIELNFTFSKSFKIPLVSRLNRKNNLPTRLSQFNIEIGDLTAEAYYGMAR